MIQVHWMGIDPWWHTINLRVLQKAYSATMDCVMSPIILKCRGLLKYVVEHIKLLVQQCCWLSSLFYGLFKVVGWLNSVADCEVYMLAGLQILQPVVCQCAQENLVRWWLMNATVKVCWWLNAICLSSSSQQG